LLTDFLAVFEDPKKLRAISSVKPRPRRSDSGEEAEALLSSNTHGQALHNISIYKPGSHLFVGGDLNYRISKTSPTSESDFPDLDPASPNYFPRFLAQDQLMSEKAAGRTLHGLSEAAITFPPTYKLDLTTEQSVLTQEPQNSVGAVETVPWKWAAHRWPAWCDRVLYLDIPWWALRSTAKTEIKINTIAYDALPPVRTSDHRAVFLRLLVPVLEPSALAPPDEVRTSDSTDPRVKLPYPVDPQAWDHRAHVKKWESVIGWSMLASQSKQGIALFVTLFFAGASLWWFRSH
jgi:hypothetical protein